MNETLLRISGYRKSGLLPDVKETFAVSQYIPTKFELAMAKTKIVMPDGDVNFGVYAQDQGNTATCWAYAIAGAMNAFLTQELRVYTCFEGNLFAADVEEINPGVSKNGNTLQDTIAKAKQLGLYDKITQKRWIPVVQLVQKKDLQVALNNDAIIFTGAGIQSKMIDKDYCLMIGNGGHAFYLNGASDVGAYGINSWRKFGVKNTGLFKARAKDYGKLFSCYKIVDVVEMPAPSVDSFNRMLKKLK